MKVLNILNIKLVFVCLVASSFFPLIAYKVMVENNTKREVAVRVLMGAATSKFKYSDWGTLKPDGSFSFNTGLRLVQGIEVKLTGSDAANAKNEQGAAMLEKIILSEDVQVGMVMRPVYKIYSTVTPHVNGTSTEMFHLLRMPNILMARPGGIVSDSKAIIFSQQTGQACRDEGASQWTYDRYHYVVAHNAFTSLKYGYAINPQQDLTLGEQLKCGIRGFMLDTYMYGGNVVIQHSSDFDKLLKLGKKPTLLKARMDEIAQFMKVHKHAIVTIFFEDYVDNDVALLDKVLENYADLILEPAAWSPLNKKSWPTLGWMRETGKRLLLFKSSFQKSKYVFSDEWQYHAENQFSTTSKAECAKERSSSKKFSGTRARIPVVLVVNYFVGFTSVDYNTTQLMFKDPLKDVLEYIKLNGLEGRYKGVNPNGLAVDFAEWGDALSLVRQWNLDQCK